jgi:predicted MFS family arabinose efflux permease
MEPRFSLGKLADVLRRNRAFRRLYAANAISGVGDFLDVVALYSLLIELTGSGESVAYALLLHLVPFFLLGPAAGVLADRISRRKILVVCDLLRAALVLCLLFVRSPELVWVAYLVTGARSAVSAFFEPAVQATVPALVSQEDLVFAGTLENSLWATTLTLGSALGGVAVATVGRDAVFVLDALSFLGSAWFLRGLPEVRAKADRAAAEVREEQRIPGEDRLANLLGMRDLREGVRYLRDHGDVRALIFVKACFGLTLGGVLVLLSWFGERVFAAGNGRGIAVLYLARGVGSLVGPFFAFKLVGHDRRSLRKGIALADSLILVCYLAFSASPSLWVAALALTVANAGGSILWTSGSTLLQLTVPDHVRGRVASADVASMTLCMSASTWIVGVLLDGGVPARALMAGCGLVAVVPLSFWIVRNARAQ